MTIQLPSRPMPSLPDIQEFLDTNSLSTLKPFRISILRNITLETIEPYLRYASALEGLRTEIQFGGYDSILQEALSASSEFINGSTDCVMVFAGLEMLSPALTREFTALSESARSAELQRISQFVRSVVSGIRAKSTPLILWHGFEIPLYPALGLLDRQIQGGQAELIQDLNNRVREILREFSCTYWIDMNLILARLGADRFYDWRYWHLAKAPYSRETLSCVALEDMGFIRAYHGRQKKCLVLDCDEILWGGVVGEEGLKGIRLGRQASGSPYYEFQQQILNLYHRGVIIAICSKNNPEDVWDVIQNHPDQLLRESHIAAAQINWDDKATNLRKIANQLNIGLDSMVFIDDSEFESDLVRQTLPEVTVLTFPKANSISYSHILASCTLFDGLILSKEDVKRGELYQMEAKRRQYATEFTDLDSYLRSLNMTACILPADDFSIPRIAQLTQKTNQFNLTTTRYTEDEIRTLVKSPDVIVLSVQIVDRFGDSGIVGVAILKQSGADMDIDTFLLSCRILGRRVEDLFLACCLKISQTRKAARVLGHYRQTAKNSQVRDFFPRMRFLLIQSNEDKKVDYAFDLADYTFSAPDIFAAVQFEDMRS